MAPPNRPRVPGVPSMRLPAAREEVDDAALVRRERDELLSAVERLQERLAENVRERSGYPPPVTQAPYPSPPPPSGRTAIVPGWAKGLAAVVTAVVTAIGTTLGGVGYAFTEYRKADTAERVESQNKLDARLARIENYLVGAAEDQAKRDAVSIAMLCALNDGAAPSRGVTCPQSACEPKALTPDGKIVAGQPPCIAREQWPAPRRPPQ